MKFNPKYPCPNCQKTFTQAQLRPNRFSSSLKCPYCQQKLRGESFVLAVCGRGADYFVDFYQNLVSRFHQQKRGRCAFVGDFSVLWRVAWLANGK